MRNQNDIFQDIFDKVASVIRNNWDHIVLRFQIEGNACREGHSYTFKSGNLLIEEAVPYVVELENLARELRDHIAMNNKDPFKECTIHFLSSGEFNAEYSYDPIEWDKELDWYFPDAQHP